jgi:hypothetical protein
LLFRVLSRFLICIFGAAAASSFSEASDSAAAKCISARLENIRHPWEPSAWHPEILLFTGYHVSPQEYSGFRDAALRVREIAGDNPVLGIGRSPGAVTAFLSILGRNDVTDVAISGFRNRPPSPSITAELPASLIAGKAANAPLSLAETQRLFKHFDETIQSYLKKHTGSRIYLVDVGKTGASLFAMKRYLDLYVAERGIKIEFDTVLFTTPQHTSVVSDVARYFGVNVHQVVSTNNYFIEQSIKSSVWDNVAAIKNFDFHETANGRTYAIDRFTGNVIDFGFGEANPHHISFRTAIQANMLTDPALKPYESSIPVLDLHVPGVRWDPASRLYRDADGNVVKISTGD